MEWKKPELICISTMELLCKVKAKANSNPSCTSDYSGDQVCSELSPGDTWGEGGDVEIGCGILAQCIEVGPLFGCNDENYCSSLLYLLR